MRSPAWTSARETLMTATEVAGISLKQRNLAMPVLPRKDVVAAAMEQANQLAEHSLQNLLSLKAHWRSQLIEGLEETLARELEMHEQTFVGDSETLQIIQKTFAGEESTEAPAPVKAVAPVAVAASVDMGEVKNTLRSMLAQELHMDDHEIDDESQFIDIGLDSITGVTWVRKINEQYGTDIDATKVYSYPTLNRLAQLVKDEADKLAPAAPAPAPVVEVAAAEPVVEAVVTVPVSQGVELSELTNTMRELLAKELHMEPPRD